MNQQPINSRSTADQQPINSRSTADQQPINSRSTAIILLILFTWLACTPETVDSPQSPPPLPSEPSLTSTPETYDPTYVFYLDEELVGAETFTLEDTALHFVVKLDSPSIEIHAFTKVQDYWDYGSVNGLSLKEVDEAANDLYTYADTSGAIASTDSTGVIPEHYLTFEEDYWGAFKTDAFLFEIEDACWATNGNDRIVLRSIPWMSGFNNRTSSFIHRSLFASVFLYDKAFYFKRMTAIWVFRGWFQQPLCVGPLAPLDNKTSSIIVL